MGNDREVTVEAVVDVRRRRIGLAAVVPVVVLVGLLVHRIGSDWAAFTADALYCALVYLLVALVLPRAGVSRPAGIAFGFSVAVELLQLTGIPGRLAESLPVTALVLGTGFQWIDLLAYAVGAVVTAVADMFLSRRTGRRIGRSDPGGSPVLDPGQRLGE